jgi:hypothetical protein
MRDGMVEHSLGIPPHVLRSTDGLVKGYATMKPCALWTGRLEW